MRDLIILGGKAHGAEMAEIVERVNHVEKRWNLIGFIVPEDQVESVGAELNGYRVLGTQEVLAEYSDAYFTPDCSAWAKSLAIPPDRLASLIDPSSFVSRTAHLGNGCVVYPHCYIGLNAQLGDYIFCLSGCIINHDDVIEDRVVMASGVTLAGYVNVEEDCYLGQAITCREFLRIGHHSLLGMGSVVVKDVPPYSVMAGNPARKLRGNQPQQVAVNS